MTDPDEGVAADGTIRTGVRRERVSRLFEPVLAAAVGALSGDASLYVYGSVATGTAAPGVSDVDLLAIDLTDADRLSARLSRQLADRCRGVEIAAAALGDAGIVPRIVARFSRLVGLWDVPDAGR